MQSKRSEVELCKPVYILESASVVGTKEGQGPLAEYFDLVGEDDKFGADTWEEAESRIQKMALGLALQKANCKPEDIDLVFAGDLLGQSIASSFGLAEYEIPFLGVYGACSTCGEALSLGAMAISGGFAHRVACVTSSHFASAEKEFRYPLEYGNQRPLSSTWTVTGSGAFVLGDEGACHGKRPKAKISGMTIGKIVDYGVKDSMNMGACMAPAAADTIERHLRETGRRVSDYDQIITGDLGSVGQEILYRLLGEKGIDLENRHMDCGMKIFDEKTQGTNSGGSGCGCCASTLAGYLLQQLKECWKRILFVPTGALLSKTSFNEGKSVPGIAHGVVLERVEF